MPVKSTSSGNFNFMTETIYRVIVGVDGTQTTVPLTPEEVAEIHAVRRATAEAVPVAVSPYQARMALMSADYLEAVEELMINPETPKAAKLAWEYATTIQRDSEFISTLGPLLNLSKEQIDDLFRAAAQFK